VVQLNIERNVAEPLANIHHDQPRLMYYCRAILQRNTNTGALYVLRYSLILLFIWIWRQRIKSQYLTHIAKPNRELMCMKRSAKKEESYEILFWWLLALMF
jgi:hypothetical protein